MELDQLLLAAGEAPPGTRIEFRDRIAAYGASAIDQLSTQQWIGDPKYAGFAIQAIKRAGELGARAEAIAALKRAAALVGSDGHRNDIAAALAVLGVATRTKSTSTAKPPRVTKRDAAPIGPEDLEIGRCYRRSALHDGGLGGNQQRGISYPAHGTHCLLFSDPSKASEYGYRDSPVGEDGYRYFGEWNGAGDMTMSGGNKVVVDRSPELYLFTNAACGRVFRGRFECLSWDFEKTTRDNKELTAIVFVLQQVKA